MGYGAHFLTFATVFMPEFNAVSYYTGSATDPGVTTVGGSLPPAFTASFGKFAVDRSNQLG